MNRSKPELLNSLPLFPSITPQPERVPRSTAKTADSHTANTANTGGVDPALRIAGTRTEAQQSLAVTSAARRSHKQKKQSPFENIAVAPRERFLRRPEVEHLTGLSRSSLYRLIEAKEFPPSIKLSKCAAAWPLSSIEAWIASRIAQAQKGLGQSEES